MTTAEKFTPLTIFGSLRWPLVRHLVEQRRPATVLELGCGLGAFGERLATMSDYLGLEPDPTSFAIARDRVAVHGGTVRQGDHHVLDPGTGYDLVCAFEVIEHIEDDAGILAEWIKLVNPGGHLMVSVPAFQERYGPFDESVGHFRRYSPSQMRRLMADAGLRDVQTLLYGWPLGNMLDVIRNRSAGRRQDQIEKMSVDARTHASGRTMRFEGTVGRITEAATVPLRGLYKLTPDRGTGLVAVGRRPAG